MNSKVRSIVTLACGAAIGMAGLSMVNHPLHAADDSRQGRMDQDKWTTGDYARDALDHLKKAETEMHKVADNENSKVAKDAAQACSDARSKTDQFLTELDARKKK